MTQSSPSLLDNATRDLAIFASSLQYRQIPASVIERIKTSVLDSIGCCLFGMTLPWTQKVQAMVEEQGCLPVASLFGSERKTSVADAVLVNATAGHAFELDDIHKESIVHPGSIALPVAIALSEKTGKRRGRDLLTAIVAGYEIGTRVGNAATMDLFFRGFHPQGTSGVFVATTTAARMLELDAHAMQHALGIAGSQAGGLMAAQEGAMVKRFHSGRAAQSGVYAALLADKGFTGITDVLEAPYGGYLSTYSGKPNAARLTDGLGSIWETEKIGYKPHASVTSIHAALDALAQLMKEHHLQPDDLVGVDIGISHMTYVHCAWEYKAQGVTAAQMNLFYSLAVMAYDGMAFVEQYHQDRLNDPRVLALIARMTARVDSKIDAMGPAFRHAAVVTVTSTSGSVFTKEILHRRGSPESPLSPAEIEYKFRHIVKPCLSADNADAVVALTRNLDQLDDIQPLLDILAMSRV
ncbi:MmgE/PrpD family protein [Bordetella tumulicola]|uniref:MmgE/PrpD family protein n=1 Tax=Bordetella tumulicola TaxID=1649133 RepID=UPI0039EF9743